MEKKIIAELSEEDKEFIQERIDDEVKRRIELCKKENYTKFQKEFLSLSMDAMTTFLECFFTSYQKKQSLEFPKKVFAKYGKEDILNLAKNFKGKDELMIKCDEIILDVQAGVFLELTEIAQKFGGIKK